MSDSHRLMARTQASMHSSGLPPGNLERIDFHGSGLMEEDVAGSPGIAALLSWNGVMDGLQTPAIQQEKSTGRSVTLLR